MCTNCNGMYIRMYSQAALVSMWFERQPKCVQIVTVLLIVLCSDHRGC